MRAALLSILLAACGGPPASTHDESGGFVYAEAPGDEAPSEGQGEAGETGDEAPPAENPDAESNTPHDATFTRCEPACPDCGLTVQVRRSMSWRAAEYEFEILTEGNHIRCAVTLPCSSPEPVACTSSPGAPRVTVETAGCGGPAADQRIVALHFANDACPEEARVEAFRAGVGAGNEAITPRYTNGRASATFSYRR